MIFFILGLAIFLLFTPASDAISISYGGAAPDFTINSVEGKSISLKEYKGKVTVIIFWRTDQDRSLLALQDAKDILDKYKSKGMEVISVIEESDNKEEALMIFKNNGIDCPLLIDTERKIYSDYGVRVLPTTVIIDRQGLIAYDIPSHPLTYKTKLRGYIKKILGEIDESGLEEVLSPHKEEKDKSFLEASRLYNLALKFTESQMLDAAIETAIKSVNADPAMLQSHILLGYLYLDTKEADKALEAFNKAMELDPKSHDAQTGLGGALILKGDIDRAVELLNSAAVANPYPQMTFYELGKAYELKGEKDKSIEMYRKAIGKLIDKKILPSSISKCE
ncbi:MAG: redoxin domain-containing protein [Nitrospirae bacterium]|nr:redoxin domain-containing protein [Nitrospirota bacterium]